MIESLWIASRDLIQREHKKEVEYPTSLSHVADPPSYFLASYQAHLPHSPGKAFWCELTPSLNNLVYGGFIFSKSFETTMFGKIPNPSCTL